MNREELSRQLNENIEVKTSVHQAWLKSQLERQGYFQAAQKKAVQRRFDFSFMNIKKFIPLVGVALFAIMAVVLWNPLVQKFGGKPTMTYAQEMLKLTEKEYGSLSSDERGKLSISIQGGDLESMWLEARSASDLQFYTGEEAWKIAREDDKELFKKSSSTAPNMQAPMFTDEMPFVEIAGKKFYYTYSLFRFTDSRGRIVHFQIMSNPHEKISHKITSHEERDSILQQYSIPSQQTFIEIKRYDFSVLPVSQYTDADSKTIARNALDEAVRFSPEQRKKLRLVLEGRLQKKLPKIWQEIQIASSTDFFIVGDEFVVSGGDLLGGNFVASKVIKLPGQPREFASLNGYFGEDAVPDNVIKADEIVDFIVRPDGRGNYSSLCYLVYINKNTTNGYKGGYVTMEFDVRDVWQTVSPLEIYRVK